MDENYQHLAEKAARSVYKFLSATPPSPLAVDEDGLHFGTKNAEPRE